MHITSSSIGFTASHTFGSQHRTQTTQIASSSTVIPINNLQAQQQTQDDNQGTPLDPKISIIKQLIEHWLGHPIRVYRYRGATPASSTFGNAATGTSKVTSQIQDVYTENEGTAVSASGKITTSDGKTIELDAALSLSRNYEQTTTLGTVTSIGPAKRQDPLVINYAAASASLSDQKFAFDLSGNGQQENISLLHQGSAYLVLDPGNTGVVSSGEQLFGPRTGNGMTELARYDQDQNGWIDENDPVYSQLRLWLKDDSGNNQLLPLASMGIGAIYLGAAQSSFNLNDANNQNLGQIRSTGIFLNENGTAGTIQQIDLSA